MKKTTKKNSDNKKIIAIVSAAAICIIAVVVAAFLANRPAAIDDDIVTGMSISHHNWYESGVSNEVIESVDISVGEKYVVGEEGTIQPLEFTITQNNNGEVMIKTTNSWSDKKSGIDLSTNKTEFKITKSDPLELTSQTMDAGTVYIINLE